MGFPGLLQVGIEIGLDVILVKPKRAIGPFTAQVTIREEHHDSMEITEQPVEKGAIITDHAFKRPAELILDVGWSNTPNSNAVGSSSSVLGSLAGAVTGTIGGITDLAGQAGVSIPAAVGQLSDVVTQPLAVAGKYITGAANDVGSAVGNVLSNVPGVPDVSGIANQIVSNVPGGISSALGVGNFPAVPGFSDVNTALSDAVDNAVGGIGDAIGDAFSDFGGSLDGLSSSQTGSAVGQIKDMYAKFLALQSSAVPFDVFTGKRAYTDMLIQDMVTVTDKTTENALFLRLRLKQVIIVATATTSVVSSDASAQSDPGDTAPTADQGDQNLDDATVYNESAGNESIDADPPTQPETAGA